MLRREVLSLFLNSLALANSDLFKTENPKKEDCATITGVGDVTLGYNFDVMFNSLSRSKGEEEAFQAPFNKVKHIFQESDISIANLEGTFTKYNNPRPKQFNFKGDPKYSRCLADGNIDIVNLANNHFMDFYSKGSENTIDALESAGIEYCGGGRNSEDSKLLKIIERKGIKFGFVGYAQVGHSPCATQNDAGTNPYNQDVTEEIKKYKENCDVLVVSIHEGVERASYPTQFQKTEARKVIDAGADIIFGHHPHVIQGVEKYNQGVIFYSLGNFVFGGNSYPSDRDSFIAQVECSKSGVESYNVIPVITHPEPFFFQPFIPTTKETKNRIIDKINVRSKIA